jgi:16S rRNA (adenine1518-N6/adenine1519-N6)-dimethyltransferase
MKKSRRHALGQHFLANRSVLRKIVDVIAPARDDTLVEVGAGKGILTKALAERAASVVAVEKDERLIPLLRKAAPENVRIVHADVLTLDFGEMLGEFGLSSARAAGNLPYSVSTPFLFKFLDAKSAFTDGFFLVQKEVAARIAAHPGSKQYAPLSIFIQNDFEVRIEFSVSPGSFSPPPKVQSSLLSLRKRPQPLHEEAGSEQFRSFVRTSFAQRRKKLMNNLTSGKHRAGVEKAFADCGLDRNTRAEDLSPDDFVILFRALKITETGE